MALRNLVLLSAALTVAACGYGSALKDVADKVPVAVVCPEPNDEGAAELLKRFKSDPDLVSEELTDTATSGVGGALAVTCDLLNVQRFILETGQRIAEADTLSKIADALEALEVLR